MKNIKSPQKSPQSAKVERISSKAAKKKRYRGSLEQNIVKLALDGELAKAGRNAVRRQLAKGLPVTYQEGDKIIRHHPNGNKEILGVVVTPPFTWPPGVKVIGGK